MFELTGQITYILPTMVSDSRRKNWENLVLILDLDRAHDY